MDGQLTTGSAATTYGPMTNATMPTADEIIRTIKRFKAKFPPSEMPVAIELPPSTEGALLELCEQRSLNIGQWPFLNTAALSSVAGLRLERNFDIPNLAFAARMADGSKVLHYSNGRKVRCLPLETVEVEMTRKWEEQFYR